VGFEACHIRFREGPLPPPTPRPKPRLAPSTLPNVEKAGLIAPRSRSPEVAATYPPPRWSNAPVAIIDTSGGKT
jgi:hypothetical protein